MDSPPERPWPLNKATRKFSSYRRFCIASGDEEPRINGVEEADSYDGFVRAAASSPFSSHCSRRRRCGLVGRVQRCRCAGRPCRSAAPPRPACWGCRTSASSRLYGTEPLEAEFFAAGDRQRRALGLAPDAPLPEVQILAVSGGGENGAFGAGLLCGWSEHGTRPVFELVTGVSTGALTAPFAYLGSELRSATARRLHRTHASPRACEALHHRGAVRRRADRQCPAVQDHLRIPGRGNAGRPRKAYRGWTPAAYRNHRPRRAATGVLEYRRHRQQRTSARVGHHPPRPARFRRDSRRFPTDHVRRDRGWQAVSGDACGWRRLRAGVPLPGQRDTAAARAHGERPVCDPGRRLYHPQRPPRSGMGEHGAQHAEHRRARHRHHDLSQWHE